jgi:Flp pilus assembly protein TadD
VSYELRGEALGALFDHNPDPVNMALYTQTPGGQPGSAHERPIRDRIDNWRSTDRKRFLTLERPGFARPLAERFTHAWRASVPYGGNFFELRFFLPEARDVWALLAYRGDQRLALEAIALYREDIGFAIQGDRDVGTGERELREAILSRPDSPETYRALSIHYRQAGDLRAAVEALRTALALRPADPDILNSLAVSYIEQRDFEAAQRILEGLVESWPERLDFRTNLSVVLLNLGQVDAALDHCAQMLKIAPDRADAYALTGMILQDKGDLPRAREAYRQALSRNPADEGIRRLLRALESGDMETGR